MEELEAKGTGDQTAAEKMQKQLDELNKKYEAAENARKEEQAKRVQADIMQQTVAALTKGNAANPSEIAKSWSVLSKQMRTVLTNSQMPK